MPKAMNIHVKTAESSKLCINESERVNPVLKVKSHTMNVRVARAVHKRKAVPEAKETEKCKYRKNS